MVEHIAPNPGITGPLLRKALTRSQLLAAWEKVRANNGCAGVDGVSVEAFASGVQARLDALRAAGCGVGRALSGPAFAAPLVAPQRGQSAPGAGGALHG